MERKSKKPGIRKIAAGLYSSLTSIIHSRAVVTGRNMHDRQETFAKMKEAKSI